MIEGACHCDTVRWRFERAPEAATACNCTICRRYGVLWIYGHEDIDVFVSGTTETYQRADASLAFHFCPKCGCVAYWRGLAPGADGRRRMGVNIRLAEPEAVAGLPVHRLDGLHTWTDLPADGRRVGDVWA